MITEHETKYLIYHYGDKISPKTVAHVHFEYFLKRYYEANKTPQSQRKGLVRTLKYYWVNHICADIVDNTTTKHFKDLDTDRKFKLVLALEKSYRLYALHFLKQLGFNFNALKKEGFDEVDFKIDFEYRNLPYSIDKPIYLKLPQKKPILFYPNIKIINKHQLLATRRRK